MGSRPRKVAQHLHWAARPAQAALICFGKPSRGMTGQVLAGSRAACCTEDMRGEGHVVSGPGRRRRLLFNEIQLELDVRRGSRCA